VCVCVQELVCLFVHVRVCVCLHADVPHATTYHPQQHLPKLWVLLVCVCVGMYAGVRACVCESGCVSLCWQSTHVALRHMY